MLLKIKFLHFWHCGSGRSAGKKVNAAVEKDLNRLPYIPGKTLRGILREAVRQTESFAIYKNHKISFDAEKSIENFLFGCRDENSGATNSGLTTVSNATLSDAEKNYLLANPAKIPLLYREVQQTRINPDTGTTLKNSLRSQEVAVPMKLSAEINLLASNQSLDDMAFEAINLALPYVDGIGALRQRGLGRCILELHK